MVDGEWDKKLRLFDAILTLTSIAGLIVLTYQSCELRQTNLLTKKSVEQTALQFEQSQRPWLSAEMKVIEPLTFDEKNDGNGSIGIEVLLKNSGQSIAHNARVLNYLIGDMATVENVVAIQNQFCEPLRSQNVPLGNVIFPGDTERSTHRVYIRKAEIDAASNRLEASTASQEIASIYHGRIMPSLITCIDYRFTLSPEASHHQTRYLSLIGERVDDFSQTSAIIPRGIIQAQLWRFFYGQHAD